MKKIIDETTTTLKALYEDKKQYQPIVAFFAGFTWDSFTLTRIDLLLDNLIMFSYILLAGVFIYLVSLIEENVLEKNWVLKYKDWYPNIVQFFFGGLFSGYVVYYFQSASITKNWLFLLFLVLLLLCNEFIKNRLSNFTFQIVFYYLATFSFFIFYLPVLFETMGALVFLLSGFVSSAFIAGLIYLLYKQLQEKLQSKLKNLLIILGSIYLIFNLLYFTNLIPPVPLSLKEAGIYHHVSRTDDGYKVRFETGSWYEPLKDSDDDFHYAPGDTVYCFASVFAPTNLNTRIFHHWQMYNEKNDEWITSDRTNYKISGGRDGGYRGYTLKKNIQPGLWRIDVETDREQLLGRVSFEIEKVDNPFELEEIVK